MFVITGCGRSGTGYIHSRLNSSGIKCGHESVYTPHGFGGWGDYVGDSSWFAAPFIKSSDSFPVVHLIRNPVKVLKSFYRIGLFSRLSWRNFIVNPSPIYVIKKYSRPKNIIKRYIHVRNHRNILDKYTSCLSLDDEISRIWKYWIEWNMLVEEKCEYSKVKYFRIKLEELDDRWEEVIEHIGYDVPVKPSKAKNTKDIYPDRPLFNLNPPDEVKELAKKYGYNI